MKKTITGALLLSTILLASCNAVSQDKQPPVANMVNPASKNCTDKGGTLEIQKQSDGSEIGMCILKDGKKCEEWAFFRGECPAPESASQKLEDKNDFYALSITYPTDARDVKGEMKQYAQSLFDAKKEEWKIGGKVYNDEKAITKQFPDRAKYSYELTSNFEKTESMKLGTISYIFSEYQFTGGAHGDTAIRTFSFGKNGAIKLEDVLNLSQNNNDIALTKLLAQKILQNTELKGMTDEKTINEGLGLNCLDKDGKFDKKVCNNDGFFYPSNFQNFVISDAGLTFIMNKYQIAAGVVGEPKISLTWSELQPFVNPSFSLPLE